MKVPKPRKLPSGAYNIRMTLGGEFISITDYDKKYVEQQALRIKTDYKLDQKAILSKQVKEKTLSGALEDYLKANKAVLSPSTLRSYQSMAKGRFNLYRGQKLKDIDFQAMINDELELVSEKTVANAWGLVRPALKHVGFPVPTVRLAAVPVNEIPFLQPEEIKPFLKAVEGRTYEIPTLLMLHGLRLSEVLGLTWEDVDLKRGVLNVHGAVVRGPDGLTEKRTNKNQTSTRPVPILIPRLLSLLQCHGEVSGRVVVINPSNLLEDVKRACKRAGGTVVTCHGLRHSFASLLYYLEIPERQIQEWGGWKDRATLHRIYIRLTAAGTSEAQKTVKGFFDDKPKKPKKTGQKKAKK